MQKAKRILSMLLAVIMVLGIAPIEALALAAGSGTQDEEITWTLEEDGTLIFSGEGDLYNDTEAGWYDYKNEITSVIIGEGILSIDQNVFRNCTALTAVSLPESLSDIGANAFAGSGITEIVIPDSVFSIEYGTFADCTELSSVTFGKNLEIIGERAFENCTKITGLSFPEYLTTIENHAFKGCTGITELSFPESVEEIGGYAFENCSNLESIGYPAGWKYVHSYGTTPFYNCRKLTSITVPEGVTDIPEYAFKECAYLSEIVFPESLESIGNHSFAGCTAITEIVVPDSVTEIGNYAFSGCTELSSVTFGKNLEIIGEHSFENCTKITGLSFPEYLTTIGNHAFKGCTGITELSFPESVEEIGGYAFENCRNLESIGYPAGWKYVHSYGTTPFYNCRKLTSITVPEGVTDIPEYAFNECAYLSEIVLPESLESIGNRSFAGCTAITEIVVPDSVTEIGNYAFSGCTQLSSVTFGKNLEIIGEHSFENCTKITGLSFPEYLTTIGNHAFKGCTGITELSFPESVEEIGGYAFENCRSLESIGYPAGWKYVHSYGTTPFYNCRKLTSITVPEGVTDIPEYAFRNCAYLSEIVLPESLESIGNHSFAGCTAITEIMVPGSVTEIGNYAFSGCTQLSSVCFCGDAPEIICDGGKNDSSFDAKLVTVYYDEDNEGWNLDSEGKWKGYKTEKWEAPSPEVFTVSLDFNGGEDTFNPVEVISGGEFIVPDGEPAREGYRFRGWAEDPEETAPVIFAGDSLIITGDLVLYAIWEELPWISVTFDPNGGTGEILVYEFYAETEYSVPEDLIPEKEGFVFLGWSTDSTSKDPEYKPGDLIYAGYEDVIYYAIWSEIPLCTVTFDANGGEGKIPDTIEVRSGDSAVISDKVPTREGYFFVGWGTDPEGGAEYYPTESFIVWESITFFAIWEEAVYNTVTFEANGGTGAPEPIIERAGLPIIIPEQIPEKENSEFLAWIAEDGTEYLPGDEIWPEGDMVLVAKWEEVRVYVLTFEANGGTGGPEKIEVPGGGKIVIPEETPEKEGFVFIGWASVRTLPEGIYCVPGDTVEINADMTLYALYSEDDRVTITYDTNGAEEEYPAVKYEAGSSAVLAEAPSRSGYSFRAWYIREEPTDYGETCGAGSDYIVNSDVTATAIWQKDGTEYPSFTAEEIVLSPGETGYLGIFIENNNGITAKSTFTNYRHNWIYINIFDGANHSGPDSGDGLFYELEVKVFEDTPLGEYRIPFALYNMTDADGEEVIMDEITLVIKVAETFTLSFDSDPGSEGPEDMKFAKGEAVTIPGEEPFLEGYSFCGWSVVPYAEEADYFAGQEVYFEEDTILYAVWEYNGSVGEYLVAFDGNGGYAFFEPMVVPAGSEIVIPSEIPEWYGNSVCIFAGWSTDKFALEPEYMGGDSVKINENVTFYAVWYGRAEYTVTFDGNGGHPVPAGMKVRENDEFELPEAPDRYGYSFVCWKTVTTVNMGGSSYTSPEVFFPGDYKTCEGDVSVIAVWQKDGTEYPVITAEEIYAAPGTSVMVYFSVENNCGIDFGWPIHHYPYPVWEYISNTVEIDYSKDLEGDGIFYAAAYEIAEDAPIGKSNIDVFFPDMIDGEGNIYVTPEPVNVVINIIEDGYIIDYDTNGGDYPIYSQVKAKDEDIIIQYDVPGKEGFTFLGWAASSDAKEPEYLPGDVYSENRDITLYAVWEEEETEITETYTITFDALGGSGCITSAEKTEGKNYIITEENIPEKEGYIFLGWKYEVPGTDNKMNEIALGGAYTYDSDIVMTAVWANEICLATYYYGDDDEPVIEKITGGETLTLPEVEDNEGFLGWEAHSATWDDDRSILWQPGMKIRMLNDWTFTAVYEEKAEPVVIVSSAGAKPGETVEIPVCFENNPGFASIMMSIGYDASALRLVEIKTDMPDVIMGNPETGSIAGASAYDITGDCVLFTLVFEVSEEAEDGSYEIVLNVEELCNAADRIIAAEVLDGKIEVISVILGDANGDGRITSRDATRILQYLVGVVDEDSINVNAADFNGDGRITSRDATAILRFLIGT